MLNLLILIGFLNVVLYHESVLGVSQVWRGFQLNINNYTPFPHRHILHEDTVISNLSMTVQRPGMDGKDVFQLSDDAFNVTDDSENQENLHEFTRLSTDDDLEKQKSDFTSLSSVVRKQKSSSNWKGRTNQIEMLYRGDLNRKENLQKEHINGLHQVKNLYKANTVQVNSSPSSLNTSFKRKNKMFNSQQVLWAIRELCCSVLIRRIRNNKKARIVSNKFVPNTQHGVNELSNNESIRQNEATETSEEKDVISNVLGFRKPKNSKEERSNSEKNLISTQDAAKKRLHLVKHHKRYNCKIRNGNHKFYKNFNRKTIVKRANLDEHLHRNKVKPLDVYKKYHNIMRNRSRNTFYHGIWGLKDKNAFRYSPWTNRPFYIAKYHVRNVN